MKKDKKERRNILSLLSKGEGAKRPSFENQGFALDNVYAYGYIWYPYAYTSSSWGAEDG